MIPCDTGPLLALIDRRDPDHDRCADTLRTITPPLVTTWACMTEAMYLVRRLGGWSFQRELWGLWESSLLTLSDLPHGSERQLLALMEKYQDTPMDLADASLVLLADELKTSQVFTLDSDFRIYPTLDGGSFDIVPA